MTEAIDGPWKLDLATQFPEDPFSNLMLQAGAISLLGNGHPVGSYRVEPGLLTLSTPMPAMSDEGEWRMEAEFLLFDPASLPDRLPGVAQIFDGSDAVMSNEACAIIRNRQ